MQQPSTSTPFDYVQYDETAKVQQGAFKQKMLEIKELIDGFHLKNHGYQAGARSADEALKALEVAYMWLGKAIRDQQLCQRTAELQEGRSNG